jgi:squalene-associated FAD-dependent desaturase
MSAPHVVVVGGGLAGLQAGLACADAGARVSLFEARPRLGGATWSTTLEGLNVDNGQHVFMRCCTAYRGFLERLGVTDRVELQRRLSVPVAAPDGRRAWLQRNALPAPAHLAASVLRFAHLPLSERLHAGLTARHMGALDLRDPAVDAQSLGDWLAARGESDAAIERFWDLLVRATLNLPAREASLSLAAKVFQTGLLERADAGDMGWARVPLDAVHAAPAAAALAARGARIEMRAAIEGVDVANPERPAVRVGGERVEADALILAVTHDVAADLLPDAAGVDCEGLRRLGASPIVNLHVVFDRRVLELPFLGAVDSPLQWIFDRSEASGLERGQYLAVSLSGAEPWVGRSRADLQRVFLPAFHALLPASRDAGVERFFITCERAATFRQAPGTAALRPGPRTQSPRLFLAGAWTDTGWPATMEGACLSGLAASRHALAAASRRAASPSLAA